MILLVEGDPTVRSLCKRMLERKAFEVAATGSGEEALGMLTRARIDLAIIDLALPDFKGDELALKLREQAPDLPIVLTSGRFAERDEFDAISSDLPRARLRLLPKPFAPAVLLGAVEEAWSCRLGLPGS